MPRRTWLDSKIDVFLEELAASSMHLDRQRAGELITGQVRAVATRMRVTGATARTYLDDEIIKDMARRTLFEVAGERPGAELMEAPRTVPLPLALVGITVAALAEAMQVRAANEKGDRRPRSSKPDGDPLKTLPAKKGLIDKMNIRKRRQSTAGLGPQPPQPPQPPQSTPGSSLVMMVTLSFTVILIQFQIVTQGSVRDLLPILIAGLLAIAGITPPNHPEL